MAQSWSATGLVELAWKKLGVTNGRDSLAQLTGIPATNLSSMNRGKRPMTVETAKKIAEATGATLLELGAPVSLVPDQRSVFDHLEALTAQAERGRLALAAALATIDGRLSRIERQLGIPEQLAQEESQ